MKPTPYKDINEILQILKENLVITLRDNLVGLYLTGSLTYGDFNRGSSDIDFLVVMNNPISSEQLKKITKMHEDIGKRYPEWQKRIEGSYITKRMLSNTESPKESRPYVNAGKIWNFVYGNEWIINLDVLYKCGVAIYGPNPKELIKPVDIADVRAASKRNLLDEWQPKLNDPKSFEAEDYDASHLQAYAILTMCRILHRAFNENVASKRVASEWAIKTYGKPWSDLIEKAESWKHGIDMNTKKETLEFIEFTIDKVQKQQKGN